MDSPQKQTQTVLYHFRHLQGENRERTKKILTDSIFNFSSPSEFNDPFDCKVHYRNRLSIAQLKEHYYTVMKERFPNLSRKQCRAQVVQDTKHLKPDEFISKMTDVMQSIADELGVLSFSASSTNILLWSHYAANHTGICLKFLAENTTPFFGLAQQVKYENYYPEIDLLATSPNDQVQAFLLTKAMDWAYEEEWRIIDHENGPGKRVFPEKFLLEVIFGARMKPEDKKDVLSWLSKRKYPVQVSQALLCSGTYSLKIEPYHP